MAVPEAPAVVTVTQLTVHFVHSIRQVLSMMASTKVNVGKPARKLDPLASHDVSDIIGFSGDFIGSMVLTFKMDTALAIVKSFAGQECPAISPEFADAIGELANMIAGSAKKSFGGTNISIPSVVIGTGHIIARIQISSRICRMFRVWSFPASAIRIPSPWKCQYQIRGTAFHGPQA